MIILCGRYGGVDQRIIEKFDITPYCIGDFILSGGELPSMIIMESIIRLYPNALGNVESKNGESFSSNLLHYCQYTRPEQVDNISVPSVLLSGHHAKISKHRDEERMKNTLKYRPDLIKQTKK